MLPTYRAVRQVVEAFGPVEVEATKTQIAFRARRRFASLWIPALALKGGAKELYLGFDLGRHERDRRIEASVEARPGLWKHHVKLPGVEAVDGQVRNWLQEAYLDALRPPPGRPRP